jgi:hypothetical protein
MWHLITCWCTASWLVTFSFLIGVLITNCDCSLISPKKKLCCYASSLFPPPLCCRNKGNILCQGEMMGKWRVKRKWRNGVSLAYDSISLLGRVS